MNDRAKEYIVRVHDAEDGTLWAEVLDLPGCFASGDNLDELRDAVQEAIAMYVASEPDSGGAADVPDESRQAAPGGGRTMTVNEMRVTGPA
jgi:predicted RNase H-like HicB family nuclease